MDLPELLEPERISCQLDIQSKKRALQTIAELLGAAVRPAEIAEPGEEYGNADPALSGDSSTITNSRLKASSGKRPGKRRGKEDEPVHTLSDMDILDALIGRERLGSTGLGHGVALPHSRVDRIESPLAALITLKEGVDFEAADGEPVDLVVGLLVPQDCNDDHLKILANLARRFSDAAFRERLRSHDNGEALYNELRELATTS